MKDDIVPYVAPFIQDNIISPNWRCSEAATMALGKSNKLEVEDFVKLMYCQISFSGSVLDGPTGDIATQLIAHTLPILLQQVVKSLVTVVRDTATWTLGRILQLHPQIATPILPDILRFLCKAAVEDEPRVAIHACWVCVHAKTGPIFLFY